jgi:CHAT domain-containing protein
MNDRVSFPLLKPFKDVILLLEDTKSFNENLFLCCLLTYGCLLRPHQEVRNLKWGDFSEDKKYIVVLSACETGSGDVQNGRGVFGLQRAIKSAGAESLIMSMWSVSDEATSEMMTLFYTHWLGGMSKRESLRKSQEEMRAKYPHPFYWGAFVMLGE